jgi:hypothetical protein
MRGFAAKRGGAEGFATVGHSEAASRAISLCLDADPIIHRGPNALLAAGVSWICSNSPPAARHTPLPAGKDASLRR